MLSFDFTPSVVLSLFPSSNCFYIPLLSRSAPWNACPGVYGAFLLACYDSNNEDFQTICKIGTGFSEVVLEERSSSLRSKVIPNPKSYYRYGDTLKPDVWFEPSEVWEVKAADLTISPVHRVAVGSW
ncbi:hypothetical protein BVRB_4g095930 [Beta vulgaris subsp. vulgaris]|nr:hypothetical protein BVRB_4g095930 [Beta vulgaris subsp. vulgaris]